MTKHELLQKLFGGYKENIESTLKSGLKHKLVRDTKRQIKQIFKEDVL